MSQKSLAPQWFGNLLSSTALTLPCVASLEIRSKPFLDTVYGIGGCWVTCPFLHSESFNSVDMGLELSRVNSRSWQSGVVSSRRLNALFAGCLRSWLVGHTDSRGAKSWIPLSLIDGGTVGNNGSCYGRSRRVLNSKCSKLLARI